MLTALAYISVRKLSKYEHPLVIIYYFPLVAIPLTIPFVWNEAVLPVGVDWIWILGIGITTQLGQIWITKGFRLLPAAQASAINYVQVLFASIWGIMLFNEPVKVQALLGGIFVLSATLISIKSRK